ncbi:lipid-A-disaccharide synthase [Hyphococcus sp.]|uniref:lipid-A-disaccharide synthase n=1 Tax=Hyphococcus sp. TaxID=2038636 RepID=UPI003CCBAE28
MKVFISAVETSGDALAAELIEELRHRHSDISVFGCGGPALASVGLKSIIDIDQLSVFGPVDAIKALPKAIGASNKLAQAVLDEKPECAIFVDSWSFSKLVAKKIKKSAPETLNIKYVAPQVWASRPRRSEEISKYFDLLLCLFDFEIPYFNNANIPVRSVGHSGFQKTKSNLGDAHAFRLRYKIEDAPILAILPGSRRTEVERHIEPFKMVTALLKERLPELNLVLVAAPGVSAQFSDILEDWPVPVQIVDHRQRNDAFAAADAALAASGTVTTELAIHNTPMVVCYKMARLTAAYVRFAVTTPYASLVNIAAGREVIPEFIQERLTPVDVASALYPLLTGGEIREAQIAAFPPLIEKLSGNQGPAAGLAADIILEWLGYDH